MSAVGQDDQDYAAKLSWHRQYGIQSTEYPTESLTDGEKDRTENLLQSTTSGKWRSIRLPRIPNTYRVTITKRPVSQRTSSAFSGTYRLRVQETRTAGIRNIRLSNSLIAEVTTEANDPVPGMPVKTTFASTKKGVTISADLVTETGSEGTAVFPLLPSVDEGRAYLDDMDRPNNLPRVYKSLLETNRYTPGFRTRKNNWYPSEIRTYLRPLTRQSDDRYRPTARTYSTLNRNSERVSFTLKNDVLTEPVRIESDLPETSVYLWQNTEKGNILLHGRTDRTGTLRFEKVPGVPARVIVPEQQESGSKQNTRPLVSIPVKKSESGANNVHISTALAGTVTFSFRNLPAPDLDGLESSSNLVPYASLRIENDERRYTGDPYVDALLTNSRYLMGIQKKVTVPLAYGNYELRISSWPERYERLFSVNQLPMDRLFEDAWWNGTGTEPAWSRKLDDVFTTLEKLRFLRKKLELSQKEKTVPIKLKK